MPTKYLARMNTEAGKPMKKFKTETKLHDVDKLILLPMEHIKSKLAPCNKVFLGVIEVLSHWIKVPEDKLAIIQKMILNLNIYSAIDDILDNTVMRAGLPATHKIFGVAKTATGFDFLMCETLGKVFELDHPKAVGIYLEGMKGTFAGQGMEVYWRDSYTCPTEEEYMKNTYTKTSSWILLLGRLMQLFDEEHKDVERLLGAIGLHFQISDDYNCLTCPKHFESKGVFCEDITEGKFSFPIVHAINSHPEVKETLIDILKKRTTDIQLKKQFLAILEKCGSFEYTVKKIEMLRRIIFEDMEKLGKNPYLASYLKCFEETN